MRGDTVTEAGRPRPLSGGLWTLFSWLRREDQTSSSDSLSSAGSDRTVASFAFLTPAHYSVDAAPIILPPPGPPTDSYKKRVRERNLRRQHERDLTLHRKYGLYRSDLGYGYDAFSLPPARRSTHNIGDRQDRERRAASESLQRRAAYVPGKRRAPSPPGAKLAAGSQATNPQRHSRKRRAPLPPNKLIEKAKENLVLTSDQSKQMNHHQSSRDKNKLSPDVTMGCKSEKYVKKENNTETKTKHEKNFLKQIFDNKKRHSAIETTSIRILPSISELDKQAAEIIETCKLKARENAGYSGAAVCGDRWLCITCSRFYDASIKSCLFCFPKKISPGETTDDKNQTIYTQTEKEARDIKFSSKANIGVDEKQKLREMLKEMKDSLPKKTKSCNKGPENNNKYKESPKEIVKNLETPTLRIGSPKENESKLCIATTSNQVQSIESTNKDLKDISVKGLNESQRHRDVKSTQLSNPKEVVKTIDHTVSSNEHRNLHMPLKISSLLNPIYVPKSSATTEVQAAAGVSNIHNVSVQTKQSANIIKTKVEVQSNPVNTASLIANSTNSILVQKDNKGTITLQSKAKEHNAPTKATATAPAETQPSTSNSQHKPVTNVQEINQHIRRRDLINQLEQSIAKGDERAAAEAAVKLAQLRLSCSVLSFSSQILGESSKTNINDLKEGVRFDSNDTKTKLPIPVARATPTSQTAAPVKSKESSQTALKKEENRVNEHRSKLVTSTSQTDKTPVRNEIKPVSSSQPQASTSKIVQTNELKNALISVWIEDKEAARGPVKLRIDRHARLGDLRREAEVSLGLQRQLQRWIVGHTLCADDNVPLVSLAGPDLSAPFYLCLVECDTKSKSTNPNKEHQSQEDKKTSDVYTELMQLENKALVPNTDVFECGVCIEECAVGMGMVLRECVHSFCRNCLADMIRLCEEPAVSCPALGCHGVLHDREIRALVTPEDYERWLARGLAAAESGTRNAFHCRTRDCTGWALCDPGVTKFPCPVCKKSNCIPCQNIHEGESCEQYKSKLQENVQNNEDRGTRALLDSLISRGEALECPECSAIIMKKWGCDWVKCAACKMEICWVTRGPRWGPNGRGDTSGGCRCGVDGKKCHPLCGYCH